MADSTENHGFFFTPEKWTYFCYCFVFTHNFSNYYWNNGKKLKKCKRCGSIRQDIEPVVADGGEIINK